MSTTASKSKTIPYGKQTLDETDIQEVLQVLKSDWISQGPKIAEFEKSVAAYCGSKYAVAVSSGTAGLHIACLAAGLTPGIEAITTPITFLATANSIVMTGATPVFADIDYKSVNVAPAEIEKKISKKTKAILPVHFAGLPCDMEEISAMARKKKITVIEDGCHALGAEYKGTKIGACRYSQMTVFSFHPVKHITTGEGGCVTTNDSKLYERMLALRNHGQTKNEVMTKKNGAWFSEMRELGYNYRITDIQAALGVTQMRKLDGFVDRRIEIAKRYDKELAGLEGLTLPKVSYSDRKHAWHLYLLRLQDKKRRRAFFEGLWEDNIRPQVHYIPVHKQPFYKTLLKGKKPNLPNAERYYEEALSLPIYPRLTDGEQSEVIASIKKNLRG
jgi:perosamine synthetase